MSVILCHLRENLLTPGWQHHEIIIFFSQKTLVNKCLSCIVLCKWVGQRNILKNTCVSAIYCSARCLKGCSCSKSSFFHHSSHSKLSLSQPTAGWLRPPLGQLLRHGGGGHSNYHQGEADRAQPTNSEMIDTKM